MAKASKPGNVAVAGITSTTTKEPTVTASGKTASEAEKEQKAAGQAATTKTNTSTSTKSSSSTGKSSSSSSGTVPAETAIPYSQQFYAALAAGIPSGLNADEYIAQDKAANASKAVMANAQANVPYTNMAPIDYVDISQQKAELRAREKQEKARATEAVNYAVASGINDLQRNLKDSKAMYQTQRNQVDADEAKALDNQVLYAEARGDRGGIGKAQYGSIQNTAANNRTAVNSAEVKLTTDTNRQIADLRAKGEFEKADKVLEISNKYLTELQNLEKWAKEKNVGVQEFNAKLRQWQNEYSLDVGKYLTDTELEAAKLSGVFSNGATTADYRNDVNNRYANAAKAMINAGIVPSEEQLAAMGWTPEQYWIYRMASNAS
jgi:hypothetical protein